MISINVKEAAIIFILSISSYWPSFYADFAFDDRPAILENKDVMEEPSLQNISHYLQQIFQHDFWGGNITDHSTSHKSYRPLTVVTFALDHIISKRYFQIDGDENVSPIPFHCHNLILHGFNSILFYVFVQKITGTLVSSKTQFSKDGRYRYTSTSIAFVSAALFSTHPVHTESVVGVVGRADLEYSLFILVGILNRHSVITTVLMSFLAVLSKEQGIVLIPIVIIVDVCTKLSITKERRKSAFFEIFIAELPWKRIFIYTCILFSIIYGRMWIMDFRPPTFQEGDNPAAFLNQSFLRQLNFSYIYGLNLWLLFAPICLCFDWSMGCLECIHDISLPVLVEFETISKILVIIFFWTIIICIMIRAITDIYQPSLTKTLKIYFGGKEDTLSPSTFVSVAMSLLIFPFIPASNIFFSVGFVIAERNLYLSVAGFCLLVAIGYHKIIQAIKVSSTTNTRLKQRRTKIEEMHRAFINILMLFIFLTFIFKSMHRSYQWRTEDTLYRSGLQVCPKNAKIYYNIAKLLQGDEGILNRRKKIKMDDIETILKLTNVDWKGFDHEIRLSTTKTDYYLNYSDSVVVMCYKTAIHLWPRYEHALNNLANVLRKRKEKMFHVEANNLLLQALDINERFSAAWMNLGIVQAQLGQLDLSEKSYFRAIYLRKDFYPDAHFNLGTLYLKLNNKKVLALYEFGKAIDQDKKHFSAWSNKVILLDELGRLEEAEISARKAQIIFPEKAEFYFHLGNIYGKQNIFEKSETNYQTAIQILDQSPVSMNSKTQSLYRSNLGVLYHRWKRVKEAIQSYEDALSYDPNNLNAKENLKILLKLHK